MKFGKCDVIRAGTMGDKEEEKVITINDVFTDSQRRSELVPPTWVEDYASMDVEGQKHRTSLVLVLGGMELVQSPEEVSS